MVGALHSLQALVSEASRVRAAGVGDQEDPHRGTQLGMRVVNLSRVGSVPSV